MDKLDQELLSELQKQGFQKSSVLAARLGVGERTVRRRINAMKGKGAIKIVALPNPVLSGYRAWAKIGIKVRPGMLFRVARELVEHPSVYFVAYSLGIFDIMVAVHFNTMDMLTYFINLELTKIKGISSVETMILTNPRKYYNFTWPEPVFIRHDVWKHTHYATKDFHELDEADHRIINALMENGLTPVRALKSRLGMGAGEIRKRTRRMLNDGVFNIEVVPNPELLEYEVWATMGLTTKDHFVHKVINAIIKNPAVYLASDSIGRFSIVIAARFHNIALLNEFIHIELAGIKGIDTVETFLHTKPLKYHNIKWSNPMNNVGK